MVPSLWRKESSLPGCLYTGQGSAVWMIGWEKRSWLFDKKKRTPSECSLLEISDSPGEITSAASALWIPQGPFRSKQAGFD